MPSYVFFDVDNETVIDMGNSSHVGATEVPVDGQLSNWQTCKRL